jgi:hypothetical protein
MLLTAHSQSGRTPIKIRPLVYSPTWAKLKNKPIEGRTEKGHRPFFENKNYVSTKTVFGLNLSAVSKTTLKLRQFFVVN